MESRDIKKKSISGAKYAILLTALTIPLSFGTNIILGRISPEALGTYGLVLIFIAAINTFILFGGNTVVVKMLPELKDDKKIPFLFTYTIIAFLIALIFIVLILFFPNVFKLMTQINLNPLTLKLFILFIPIVIIQQLILYALNGIMEIKISVVLEKVAVVVNFIVLAFLFVFFRNFIERNYQILIWMIYAGVTLISAVLGAHILYQKLKEKNYKKNLNFFTPKKFWSFALFVHALTLLSFFYEKLDNLFMVNYFSVSELGYYIAALQTASLVTLVPALLGRVMLPAFSNLLAANNIYLLKRGYQAVIKYNVIITVPIALGLIFFSKEAMGIFGISYATKNTPLIILSASFALTVMGQINSPLAILKNRTGLYLLNSVIQISVQVVLIILLIKKYEAIGLSIARGVGLLFAQAGLFLIVFKSLNLKLQFPRSYIASFIAVIIALFCCFILPTRSTLASCLLFSATILVLIIIGDYGIKDIVFLKKHLFFKGNV